jgi:hypothetical protein
VLALRAYCMLVYFDAFLSLGKFSSVCRHVRDYPVHPRSTSIDVRQICDAVDLASIWYWKKVLCLQRSTATTCLLRTYGIPAQLVIGAQQIPFRAHAWVEVAGQVVNDKPYTPEMFAVLDRC